MSINNYIFILAEFNDLISQCTSFLELTTILKIEIEDHSFSLNMKKI